MIIDKLENAIAKMFAKPKKQFYFIDRKNNSYISVYNNSNKIETIHGKRSKYVLSIVRIWKNSQGDRFNNALQEAMGICKKYQYQTVRGGRRFLLDVEKYGE